MMSIFKGWALFPVVVVLAYGPTEGPSVAQTGSSLCPTCPATPCPGCVVGVPPGDNGVNRTIPPGYTLVYGTFALRLSAGRYITAPSGGGPTFTGPNSGPQAVSFHVNTKTAGAWEHFQLRRVALMNGYELQTANGQVATFVKAGGVGGPNDGTAPIHTDATSVGADEKFLVAGLYQQSTGNFTDVTIRTRNGYYLTAVGGGGIGAPSTGSGNNIVHTDQSLSAVITNPLVQQSAIFTLQAQ
jgi:hypothetical protein